MPRRFPARQPFSWFNELLYNESIYLPLFIYKECMCPVFALFRLIPPACVGIAR